MERIENKIKELSSENIIPRKNNRIIPIIAGAIGVGLFLVGIIGTSTSSAINGVMIFLGLAGITWGVISGIKAYGKDNNHFIYQPSGKKMKKYNLYFTSHDMEKVEKCLREKNFSPLNNVHKEMNANRLLVVMAPDDGGIALAQTFEYIPYNYEPVSEVYILKEENAKKMLNFCKTSAS